MYDAFANPERERHKRTVAIQDKMHQTADLYERDSFPECAEGAYSSVSLHRTSRTLLRYYPYRYRYDHFSSDTFLNRIILNSIVSRFSDYSSISSPVDCPSQVRFIKLNKGLIPTRRSRKERQTMCSNNN